MKRYPGIAFLIPGLGIVDRGAENVVFELSKRLSKNYNITILSRGEKPELKKYKTISVKKINAVSRDNLLTNLIYKLHPRLSYLLDIVNLSPQGIEMLTFTIMSIPTLLTKKFDILFPVNGFWGALLCSIIRAIKKTPFVYASHGGEEPMIARLNPDVYIALTQYTKKWLKNFNPSLKVVYIPNGVDIQKFSPNKNPTKLNLERPIFLTVAAFIPAKRIDLAIKAVSKLNKGSLLILGDGPLKLELEQLGHKLLGSKRFAIKRVPYSKIPNYYTACNVFTLPSYLEPSPLAYLEAAASNLPMVAPDEERRKSILENAAIYCDVENINDYTNALKKASQMAFNHNPRKQAEKFSWEKIGKKYKKLFSKLIN